ncbi:MAG: GNAT family N-acetyltransferase [Zymomonas mobilis subsp. pomaceae]|uniref:GCN5-related N-acetyltransferase n=1 Tax=Zymomonas mobilis subsp. pomaceae (strain ATCC 29192 / DSM 22645 / JCM 10191 / CCUG 17912 / NBRC 13757 / NCIMB 11200 / NRRL B-4491 / Barker I) TaxID=579138 RepID=F8EUK7_ZYMMT|nr:GNAT family N-acetyltransferase [Zymomonas mobilis]AEI37223.1 GCN5-related N-acetyltransferase [Zymomonas mobilis subsp. pomaceae ATCC 29192]MDX5948593.1 GNAT family N-acetyltransferase [Zymomonas mobilis subsp. pomaceae]GEB88399.1 N-acetyltransferase [Zymomonas mobilis subsp. pomaceae]
MAFFPLKKGQLASLVTALEMVKQPDGALSSLRSIPEKNLSLSRWIRPSVEAYKEIFQKIGSPWLWFSRLELEEHALLALIHHPKIEIYRVFNAEKTETIGISELDFREKGQCEITFFGLSPDYIGQGIGNQLMGMTLEKAWQPGIRRIWLHSCSFDHPSALSFYQRHGFKPFQRMIEIHSDPRITGLLPKEAAPHIPVIL